MLTADFSPGGFRFIPSVFQYSGGVVASPGYRIMRIRFMTPVALAQGFRRIEVILSEFGRPTTALCACELRSPAPFSKQGFTEFNKHYVTTLSHWRILTARSIQSRVSMSVLRSIRRASPPSMRFRSPSRRARPPHRSSFPAAKTSFAKARRAPMLCEKKPSPPSAKWKSACRRSASAGPTRPQRRSIRCMTFTRSLRTRSFGGVPPDRG